MKFLTFDQIKQQLRLDDEQATAEQSILEMYAASAEDSVLNIIRRSYEDVLETFGAVPSGKVCQRRDARPELDAERCRPACIALQSQNEVRLVIDSKDCNVCHILDYYYYRIRRR